MYAHLSPNPPPSLKRSLSKDSVNSTISKPLPSSSTRRSLRSLSTPTTTPATTTKILFRSSHLTDKITVSPRIPWFLKPTSKLNFLKKKIIFNFPFNLDPKSPDRIIFLQKYNSVQYLIVMISFGKLVCIKSEIQNSTFSHIKQLFPIPDNVMLDSFVLSSCKQFLACISKSCDSVIIFSLKTYKSFTLQTNFTEPSTIKDSNIRISHISFSYPFLIFGHKSVYLYRMDRVTSNFEFSSTLDLPSPVTCTFYLNNQIYFGQQSGSISVWHSFSNRILKTFNAHPKFVFQLYAFMNQKGESILYSCGGNGCVSVFNLTKESLQKHPVHTDFIRNFFVFAETPKMMVLLTVDGYIIIFDFHSAVKLRFSDIKNKATGFVVDNQQILVSNPLKVLCFSIE